MLKGGVNCIINLPVFYLHFLPHTAHIQVYRTIESLIAVVHDNCVGLCEENIIFPIEICW